MKLAPFSPKQLTVLTWWCKGSPYEQRDAVICDGAVRSGKTLCMSLSFVFWALSAFEDGTFALCGKTVTSLRRNLVSPLTQQLTAMGMSCRLLLSRSVLEVSYGGNTATFYLFGGRDESSASNIQGITLCGVLLDEVALMPHSFVQQALARCSVQGSRMWFNCNPEHPAHWFYREWICKCEQKNALYLHFTMQDNPALSDDIRARYESLYSGTFFERFIQGKWVACEGLVYPHFSEQQLCDVPAQCDCYYLSCDYGTVNPFSLGLWGRCDGVWYRVAEYYYDSRRRGAQKTDEEYYDDICRLAGSRRIEGVVCDPSAASFLTLIRRRGVYEAIPAVNRVSDGIRQVGDALTRGEIRICRGCEDAVREFSLYRWDENGAKDRPIKENDHAMDDIRYFVATVLYGEEDSVVALSSHRQTPF